MVLSAFIRFKMKILERHTGVSPETNLEHRFNEVRSDLSFFYSLNPFNYANFKWSKCMPEM